MILQLAFKARANTGKHLKAKNNLASRFCIVYQENANINSAMMELQPKLGLPVKEGDHLHYIPAPEADKLHGQVLAQIDHLPTELLVQIFQLCIRASLIAFPGCDVHRHLKR